MRERVNFRASIAATSGQTMGDRPQAATGNNRGFRAKLAPMVSAFFKAFNDLGNPRLRVYLWQTVLLSLTTAILVWGGLSWALFNTEMVGELPWVGGLIEMAADYLGVAVAFVLMVFLLPAFMGLYASFYIEAICSVLEARHYPGIAQPKKQTILEGLKISVKFAILLITLNILLLPLIFIPPVYFIAGWAINGFLLGREYLEMVGFRRMNEDEIVAYRTSKNGTIYMTGLVLALVATIPLVNLLLPFLGTSMMLHCFERTRPKKISG